MYSNPHLRQEWWPALCRLQPEHMFLLLVKQVNKGLFI